MKRATDAREVICIINERERRHQRLISAGEPEVGILWLINKKLIVSGTCLSLADQVDRFKTASEGHDRIWRLLALADAKLKQYPYDYFPRGRVTFDTVRETFYLYLDPCIVRKKSVVSKIFQQMRLPTESTELLTDEHYRCATCNPDYLSFMENEESRD